VNKKKQKNFINLGPCHLNAPGPKSKKFFAPLFFKKAATFLLFLFAALPATAAPSPVGRWLTTNRQAVIEITPCGADFCGQIVGIIVRHAGDPMPLDWLGRPQCGFVMIRTRRQTGTADAPRWAGTVQDPRDGNTYDANLSVGKDGQLRLRGYVGLPLFGETQRWTRFYGRTFADCRLPGNNPEG
jgi:uncharacterized protein (DUF2147 family)